MTALEPRAPHHGRPGGSAMQRKCLLRPREFAWRHAGHGTCGHVGRRSDDILKATEPRETDE